MKNESAGQQCAMDDAGIDLPISSATAQSIVLRRVESRSEEKFAIQSCELSPQRDYWIIRGDNEDYVLRGMREKCRVGVSAYLVSTARAFPLKSESPQVWPSATRWCFEARTQ